MNADIDKHERFWFEDGNLVVLVNRPESLSCGIVILTS